MKWKLLPAVIALACSANAQSQSLEQAVATSLATNPKIQQSFNDLQSYKLSIGVAAGAYKPSLDLSAYAGKQKTNSSTTRSNGNDDDWMNARQAKLTLRQLIWDGSTQNNIDRTKSEAEAARYQLLSDVQDKALEVAQAYIAVVKAQKIVDLSEDNIKVLKKLRKDIKRRTDTGMGIKSDITQVDARISKANSNLMAAKNNLADANSNFTFLVNERPDNLVFPEVDANYLPTNLDDALSRAHQYNPVLKISSHDIEATRYQKDMRDGAFLPSFSVEASQEYGKDLSGVDGDYDQTSVLLTMDWNLLNGGADKANSEKMVYEIRKAQNVQKNALDELNQSTKLSWDAYQLTDQQRKFLQTTVDSTAATLNAYEKEFQIGKRTLLDLLNTENELFETRQSYITSYYDFVAAKYRVLNATGQILDEMRVATPKEWYESIVEQSDADNSSVSSQPEVE